MIRMMITMTLTNNSSNSTNDNNDIYIYIIIDKLLVYKSLSLYIYIYVLLDYRHIVNRKPDIERRSQDVAASGLRGGDAAAAAAA